MVDYLFPFVNQNDPIWQQEYRAACNKYGKKYDLNDVRFRDVGLLRYHFRGIAKFMPWIHKPYMIVSSESQVPNWLNQDTVGIILHKDFIEPEFLPCFNSNRIEMFLAKIDCISEKFIYANDDFYIVGKTKEEDFFDGDRPVLYMKKKTSNNTEFQHICKRTFDILRYDYPNKYKEEEYLRPPHNQTPFTKSIIKEVWLQHSAAMKQSIASTPFRNYQTDFNQYLYPIAATLSYKHTKGEKLGRYCDLTNESIMQVSNAIYNPQAPLLCINDGGASVENLELVKLAFQKRLPDKCKYEC